MNPDPERAPQMTWEQAVAWLRAQPDQRDLVLASYFDDPLTEAAERFTRSPEWEETRRALGSTRGSALDVGAGRGVASYALAKLGFQVTALEPDGSDLVGAGAIAQLARETGVPLEVCRDHGERLPFPDGAFDLVYCRQAVHHAQDLRRFCAEAARVLKPGGQLLALREHVVDRREDVAVFQRSHPLHRFYGGENAYTLAEYRAAFEQAGLVIHCELNPLQSAINYSPLSLDELRARARRRLRLPFLPNAVVDLLLRAKGALDRTPGRLFSFVVRKPA